jgi:hypothetical protein
MTEISLVFGCSARRTSPGLTRPLLSTPTRVTVQPFFSSAAAVCRIALCSMGRDHHVISRLDEARQSPVVAFGSAAGEGHLQRMAVEQLCHAHARMIQHQLRAVPIGVQRRGVAELIPVAGYDLVQHRRQNLRRAVVV